MSMIDPLTSRGNHSAHHRCYSSEASTYSAQGSLKVWVFKQAFLDNLNPDNTSGLKMVDARPVIECAEVFPKRPSQRDLSFDILWSELSDKPNEGPDTKFTVQLERLHQLAKAMLIPPGKHYDKAPVDYPAAPDTPTTDVFSHTCSQGSSSSSSKSSRSVEPSY